ncbi:DUF4124 domain-containing protein [Pseudoalteromonas sp. G4]|uniref:DUF4124 domain-containing protein n=1 Tax=Pseudoalteromonas sp. G4 TaxID=2992761 RepID=UPI00237ECC86|nr:DUF4124 domain-containing protein [Pseudoalteromonas sp. G4]MDE3271515.1 DUF4124 domain-containing protein [Pseudoalteromonas sp. G4]
MAFKGYQLSLLIFLLLLPVADIAAKEIYMWRDENGVLVFSDTKRPGAKVISLADDKVTSMKKADTSVFDTSDSQTQAIKYGIEIVSPSHEDTIRDNTGSLHVSTRITPSFNPKFKVQLLFNGKRNTPPQSKAVFVMRNVDRGAHTIQAQLFNEKGEAVATSEQITFFMHRASSIAK